MDGEPTPSGLGTVFWHTGSLASVLWSLLGGYTTQWRMTGKESLITKSDLTRCFRRRPGPGGGTHLTLHHRIGRRVYVQTDATSRGRGSFVCL